MGQLTLMEPTPLTIYPWGEGIADVRYFTANIFMPSEIKNLEKASGYMPTAYDFKTALKALELTMAKMEPGIYFAGNPLEGTYGKWNCVLKAAGWKQVPGCALNRVWGNWRNYKGPAAPEVYLTGNPWDSPDGQNKWIHAFYHIVPGRKKAIVWDFSEKTRNLQALTGDADMGGPSTKGSLWHINYGGSPKIHEAFRGKSGPQWCRNFGRLSKSCGIAMGYGLPECGPLLDEEFFTIAAQELGKEWPKGWQAFLDYGGMSFATNLGKLTTGLIACPHPMEVK